MIGKSLTDMTVEDFPDSDASEESDESDKETAKVEEPSRFSLNSW